RRVTLLGILKGSAIFAADLARAVGEPAELSFCQARSYGAGTESSGTVYLSELETEVIQGRPVVVCDAVLDTGRTLRTVLAAVRAAGATEVASCVLVDKEPCRVVDVSADWVGFPMDGRFFVGYGLDHAGAYRTLPYVGVVEER
ncbi:MAG: phosphoribosyltransferase family protein, partial [Planctomycetota bacterium]|nr:phosphoribosyltransferase family protein [Planctomycetota bacterium]